MERMLVVGGGVIGLMTARELALSGCQVTLLERGDPGREASWAGGGIVSPLYPWRYAPAVTALSREARAAYPSLVAALQQETGIDAELESCGMLMLDAEDARDALAWAANEQEPIERYDAVALSGQWPWLAVGWLDGLFMPGVAHVRNPRLLQALRASVERLGVVVLTAAEVVGAGSDGDRIASLHCRDGREFAADQVILCGGAWSRTLLESVGAGFVLPVRPVKGQMLLYRAAPGLLPCMVMNNGRYLIQRKDGHILCGSTLEETGFEKATTSGAREALMLTAGRLLPALAGQEPVAQWAGLRPGSPNGIPFIGRVPGICNLWVNTGHFRNGLVLAPASARLMADLVLQRAPLLDPAPYQCL